MQKLASIQVLRGIAALGVFIFHLFVTLDRYSSVPLGSWVRSGQMGVDLFFVISGFVMVYSVRELGGPRDASRFLFRRFWRIAPPLYALTVAHLLFKTVYGTPTGIGQIINCFTILPVVPTASQYNYALIPAWTLGFEFAFYLIVATTVVFDPHSRTILLITVLSALPFLPLVWPAALSPYGSPQMIEFAFGVAAFGVWERRLITTPIAFLSLALALALIGFPLPGGRVAEWGAPMALLFVAAIRWTVSESRWSAAFLWLGSISYSLYLSHVVVFDALAPLLSRVMPLALMGAILLITGLWVAACVYAAIERPLLSATFYRANWNIYQMSPFVRFKKVPK